MMRTALSFLLFTAACTGTIGGDDPPTEQVTNTVTVVLGSPVDRAGLPIKVTQESLEQKD